jgi:ELWxxDGT repeat protein
MKGGIRLLLRAVCLAALAAAALPASASAQAAASLVSDVFPGPTGSNPTEIEAVGGGVFLSAQANGAAGNELLRSDGTPAGTVIVDPAVNNSDPTELTAVGSTLFFTAFTPASGTELWRSDGTVAGTELIEEIGPSTAGSTPSQLTAAGGTLFFLADDGTRGLELWRSDGTAGGTDIVEDVVGGAGDPGINLITAVGESQVLFRADDGTTGGELYRSDGTDVDLVEVINTDPAGDSEPQHLTNVGGVLFFNAFTTPLGQELYKSAPPYDAASTELVEDICATPAPSCGSGPIRLGNVGGTLFFAANNGVNGYELWRSDGTAPGTSLVADIDGAATGAMDDSAERIAALGSTALFEADGGTGDELWRSDGSVATLVKEIDPAGEGQPEELTAAGGLLFFRGINDASGNELWRTDGTTAGTVPIEIGPGATGSFPFVLEDAAGTLFLNADDGAAGSELWKVTSGSTPPPGGQPGGGGGGGAAAIPPKRCKKGQKLKKGKCVKKKKRKRKKP